MLKYSLLSPLHIKGDNVGDLELIWSAKFKFSHFTTQMMACRLASAN